MSDAGAGVSLIVVSRQRTAALLRAITAIRQLDHPLVELIVVADPPSAEAVSALGLPVKVTVFAEANISAARNAGLARAAGGVVAFLDDDAVPEPSWLSRLVAPFGDARVAAAGGFVRGRNGISFQWRAAEVDAFGRDLPFEAGEGLVRAGSGVRAVKTQGTNCAFRRLALLAVGGFDPALRFYLDEADVNLRLGAAGGWTAVVPAAEVHHGFAASARRRADRVPTDLSEIAASVAVFLRRHAPGADMVSEHTRLWEEQRARALRHMISGGMEPRDVGRLMATLTRGWRDGMARALLVRDPLATTAEPFLPLPGTGPRPGRVLAGRVWQRGALEQAALEAVASGEIVTLFLLGPDARRHSHRFDPRGFWVQQGGVLGQAERTGPRLVGGGFAARIARETARLAAVRPVAP